jgi:uncharacterized phiE125 gp8 family phage protein
VNATSFIGAPWYVPPVVSALVVAPVEEPLTLAEGKLRAGLDWPDGDPRDDLMRAHIAAARAQVEFDTGLALLQQTRAITFYASSLSDGGIVPLPMQSLPLQSLTDPDGQPVPMARWRSGFPRRLSILQVDSGVQAGTWTAVVGWPTPAALLAEAPLLVQAVGLLVSHYATVGRDLTIVGAAVATTPMGYRDCVDPYTLQVLP